MTAKDDVMTHLQRAQPAPNDPRAQELPMEAKSVSKEPEKR